MALTFLNFACTAGEGAGLYGINLSMKFVDDFIIIPSATGSLLTGVLYAIFTRWGWFKHRWIIVKWAINIFGILFGTFWLGPWVNAMPSISQIKGLGALSDAVYLHNQTMLNCYGTFQMATIIFALFVSALKPWGGAKSVKNRVGRGPGNG